MITRETGTTSPPVEFSWWPMRTSIAAAGQDAGDATAAPVSDEQWPAVRTVSGEISVPVHWNMKPKLICATAGYSPAEALVPPTIASEGEAVRPSEAHAIALVRI